MKLNFTKRKTGLVAGSIIGGMTGVAACIAVAISFGPALLAFSTSTPGVAIGMMELFILWMAGLFAMSNIFCRDACTAFLGLMVFFGGLGLIASPLAMMTATLFTITVGGGATILGVSTGTGATLGSLTEFVISSCKGASQSNTALRASSNLSADTNSELYRLLPRAHFSNDSTPQTSSQVASSASDQEQAVANLSAVPEVSSGISLRPSR